jgi:kinetochore protein Spc7/SPC105
MGTQYDKENIADGLVATSSFNKAPSSSPKKSTRKKTRSKSIGPGGLGLDEAPLKETTGNRRKVMLLSLDSLLNKADCSSSPPSFLL